jgi:hypothetical protein
MKRVIILSIASAICGACWCPVAMLFTENLLTLLAVFAIVSILTFFTLCLVQRERRRAYPY